MKRTANESHRDLLFDGDMISVNRSTIWSEGNRAMDMRADDEVERYTGWLPAKQVGRLMTKRMEEIGWSQARLIREIRKRLRPGEAGGLQTMISKCKNGISISDAYLPHVEALLNLHLRPDGYVSQNWQNDVDTSHMTRAMSPSGLGLPLFASVAGSGGTMLLEEETMQRKEGPVALEGVQGAYGLRVTGSIMEPRYFPGEVIWLNPEVPGKPGDFVLLFHADGSTRRCLRWLISETETTWTVRQLNPDRKTKMQKTDWPRCLHVRLNV